MRALDGGSSKGDVKPDINRLCTTTWVLKDLRTKYCAQTGGCIEEFDHYCPWLNTSIGKKNHRQFFILVVVEWITQLIHIYLLGCMAWHLVPYTSFGSWIAGVITGYPLLTLLAIIQCCTAPWIFMLIRQQGRFMAMNLTTNEMINMHRYEHFWHTAVVQGQQRKMFHNPFCKGSQLKNCWDFWWARKRSVLNPREPKLPKCCPSEQGGGHRHSYGGA